MFSITIYFETNPLAYKLWTLVALTRASGAQCSNDRDAIYGVLSVAADAQKLKIYPDYDIPIEQCYIHAAKIFLRHNHLDVLTACQQPRSLLRLPSWVPDFSTRWSDEFNVVTPIEHMARAAEDIALGTLFCAAKGSSPNIFSFEKIGQQLVLCLAGVKVDIIERIAPAFTQDDFNRMHTWKAPDLVNGALLGEAKAIAELKSSHRDPDAFLDAMLAQIKAVEDLLRSRYSRSPTSMETILRVLTKDMEVGAESAQQGGQILHRLPPAILKTYVPFVNMLQQSKQLHPFSAKNFVFLQQEFVIF